MESTQSPSSVGPACSRSAKVSGFSTSSTLNPENHVADVWAHEGGLNDIAADPNGAYLVTAGSDGLTIAWRRDGDQLVQIASRVHASSFGGVAVSGDGSWIYSAGYDDRAVRWSPEASASDDLTLKVNSWGFGDPRHCCQPHR